jgi:hypothetical protein
LRVGGNHRDAGRGCRAQASVGRELRQPGALGANLSLVENPDTIVDDTPSECSGCGAALRRARRAGVIRRQVVDLPPVRPPVTEHRLHRLRCRGCRHITTAPACYGPNVTALAVHLLIYQHIPVARTAQLLEDLLGLPVSTGWVAGVINPVACPLAGFAERRLHPTPDRVTAAPAARW